MVEGSSWPSIVFYLWYYSDSFPTIEHPAIPKDKKKASELFMRWLDKLSTKKIRKLDEELNSSDEDDISSLRSWCIRMVYLFDGVISEISEISFFVMSGCIERILIVPNFLSKSKIALGVNTSSGPPDSNPSFFLPSNPPG